MTPAACAAGPACPIWPEELSIPLWESCDPDVSLVLLPLPPSDPEPVEDLPLAAEAGPDEAVRPMPAVVAMEPAATSVAPAAAAEAEAEAAPAPAPAPAFWPELPGSLSSLSLMDAAPPGLLVGQDAAGRARKARQSTKQSKQSMNAGE
ncbi:hypothetical protein NS226_04575 [Aureimonas ureilytica]|uniref:Uncharacterized protein n=1 Tax=Aureimonas ureilytica TaxID=401562 RepID=A0A175RAX4_9HYPH|nr:hypothetical protein NS226_04575 [Aureimonas ureilytica]